MSVTFIFNVTDVNVYPYVPRDEPIVVGPVVTGAQGQYVVGTFGPSVGYQLYISGGEQPGKLTKGASYYATAKITSTQPPYPITNPDLETHVVHFQGTEDGKLHFGFVQTFGRHENAPEPEYEEVGA
jgi:hypothetical protein